MSHHSAAAESLGSEKIGKLLLQYSLPAIIAMTASSLYNIVDRIFIGHGVGPLAISGLALTLPLMNLAAAFGALVGAGAAALVSIRLGEQRLDEAERILGNTVLLNVVLSSTVAAVMLFFLDRILYLFGASPETLPYARQFMQIILACNVIPHSYLGLNNIMRASGYPRKAMVATLTTVGMNVLLAPLFIFVFHWGIRGAAIATVTAQTTGLCLVLSHFLRRDSYVRFLAHRFTVNWRIIGDILAMGMSNFIVNLCTCLITIVINLKLVAHGGDYAVGAFGIINSILMCAVMIVLGLTQGMQPIAGFNYGARRFSRVNKVFHEAVLVATGITTFAFLTGEIFPRQIALAFTSSRTLVDLAVTGMRLVLAVFPLVGFQIVTSNFFQAIGHPKISIVLTLSRQVIFLLPALLVLPGLFGLVGVWSALPVSDCAACALAFALWKSQGREIRARAAAETPRPDRLVETESLT